MLEEISAYLVPGLLFVVAIVAMVLYVGRDNVPFLKRKIKEVDEGAAEKVMPALQRFAAKQGGLLLRDLNLYYKGAPAHFDAVVTGPFGVLGVNALGRGGELYGQPGDENWAQIIDGKKTAFANPLRAAAKSAQILRQALAEQRARVSVVDTLLVLTDKTAAVNIPASAGYVPLADLGRALDAPKYRKDNGCDPKASAEALEKYRQ